MKDFKEAAEKESLKQYPVVLVYNDFGMHTEDVNLNERTAYYEGYLAGYSEAMKEQRWIPVSERLPDVGDNDCIEVLCIMNDKYRICDFITGDGQNSFYSSYRKHFDEVTSMVTHWMPLPSFTEQSNKDENG
jgi:hypothetical protein